MTDKHPPMAHMSKWTMTRRFVVEMVKRFPKHVLWRCIREIAGGALDITATLLAMLALPIFVIYEEFVLLRGGWRVIRALDKQEAWGDPHEMTNVIRRVHSGKELWKDSE